MGQRQTAPPSPRSVTLHLARQGSGNAPGVTGRVVRSRVFLSLWRGGSGDTDRLQWPRQTERRTGGWGSRAGRSKGSQSIRPRCGGGSPGVDTAQRWEGRAGLRGRGLAGARASAGKLGGAGTEEGKAVASAKLSEAAEGCPAVVSPGWSPTSRAGVEGGSVTRSSAQVLGPFALFIPALGLALFRSQLPSL